MQYVLQHYRHPLHHGALHQYTHATHMRGKLCGDDLHIYLQVEDDRIINASFDGACCAVTTAAASILLDKLIGKSTAELEKFDLDWILEQLQIDLPQSRLECAVLPLLSVQEALRQSPSEGGVA